MSRWYSVAPSLMASLCRRQRGRLGSVDRHCFVPFLLGSRLVHVGEKHVARVVDQAQPAIASRVVGDLLIGQSRGKGGVEVTVRRAS